MKVYRLFSSMLVCGVAFLFSLSIKAEPPELPERINGAFRISVYHQNRWTEAGRLEYGKDFTTKTLDISRLGLSGKTNVRITHDGTTLSHIDAIRINGHGPQSIKAESSDNRAFLLKKLIRSDYDVINADESPVTAVFMIPEGGRKLELTARCEPEIISDVPFQFPLPNMRSEITPISEFYTYRLNANVRSFKTDGVLDEAKLSRPLFTEFCEPATGHPDNYTYAWIANDENFLYAAVDFVPDNTMDGDKDYARLYVRTTRGVRCFKVSVPEQTWGKPGFTYTPRAVYQHKTYEFKIPLAELGLNSTSDNEIGLAFAAYGTAAASRVIFVRPGGNDANDGLTWADAKQTVGAALSGISPDEQIWLKAGTYPITATLDVFVNCSIFGGFDGTEYLRSQSNPRANVTVLDGQGTIAPVVNITTACTLDGVTVTGGNNSITDAGGIRIAGVTAAVSRCIIEGNTVSYAPGNGGGVYISNASPVISQCIVRNNSAPNGSGGGIYVTEASPTIENCLIHSNTSYTEGGGVFFAAMASNNPTIRHCTIANNTSTDSTVGGFYNIGAGLTTSVTSSIFWGNSNSDISSPGTTITVDYSDVDGGFAGTGNINSDPLFAGAGDYHLTGSSPCIQAAETGGPDKDLDGRARPEPASTSPDMGAYEFNEIVFVSPDGDNTDGSSWSTAFTSIQDGINAAPAGGQVWVMNGTYALSAPLAMTAGISVHGGFNGKESGIYDRKKESTSILDGQGSLNHVVLGASSATLTSFTITGGNAQGGGLDSSGGGMLNNGCTGLKVENCVFLNNQAQVYGGGMHNENCSPELWYCTFDNNAAGTGGGGLSNISSAPLVHEGVFKNNTAPTGAGMAGSAGSSPVVVNSIFHTNTASGDGGAICNSGADCTITNCTISANSADQGGGVANFTSGTIDIYNTILWNNTAATSGGEIYNSSVTPTVDYSNIEGGINGTKCGGDASADGGVNINADPLFVNTAVYDFHISSGSPCIDAAWSSAPNFYASDYDRVTRYDDPATAGGLTADIGAFEFATVYVTSGGSGDGSQASPFGSIQSAITTAVNNGTVLVGDGTYIEPINYNGKGVRVVSQNGAASTTIDGNASMSVVSFLTNESRNSILDGFTITNGFVAEGGGIYIYGASPTIQNCIITSNTAHGPASGGGIYCDADSKPYIKNCEITLNTTINICPGGGIAVKNGSEPLIEDCLISQNTSVSDGGGIHIFNADAQIKNCRITQNTSDGLGGGIYVKNGDPIINHCTIADNNSTGFHGAGVYLDDSVAVFTNCNIIANDGTGAYGGGVYCIMSTLPAAETRFIKCVITDNRAGDGGGIACRDLAAVFLEDCIVAGNESVSDYNGGGGIFAYQGRIGAMINCAVIGNVSSGNGGGICTSNAPGIIINTTLARNHARLSGQGGGIYADTGMLAAYPVVYNSILWDNTDTVSNEQIVNTGGNGQTAVDYSCIQGGYPGNNINSDPLFPAAINGAWSAGSTFDSSQCQTTHTDGNASWSPGSMVGKFLQPDTTSLLFPIIANTATTITVWGDNTSTSGGAYSIYDFSINSGSPCVDAADGTYATDTDYNGNVRFDDPGTADTGTGSPAYADMGYLEFFEDPTVGHDVAGSSGGESGTALYWVNLSHESAKTITVDYAVSGGTATAGTDYTFTPGTLTFEPGVTSLSIPAEVIADTVPEADETIIVDLSNPVNATLSTNFSRAHTILDDDTAGFTVTESGSSTLTAESGTTDDFTVVLDAQPESDVVIDITSSDTGEATVSPASLTFTSANWNTAQTVTVTGVDDSVVDGDTAVSLTLSIDDANSNDFFDPLADHVISVSNTDDDTAGITVSAISGSTTEAGGTATFTVVLNSEPIADVSIALSSSDTTEGTVSPASLAFTTATWNTAQLVTVTGVDDTVVDGDTTYAIVTAAASSSDTTYNGMDPGDVTVINTDDDTAGYSISGTVSGDVSEGVLITLSGNATDTTTTAADGSYSFTGLASGTYTLAASMTGYTFSPSLQAANITTSNLTDMNFIAAQVTGDTFTLSGTVSGYIPADLTLVLTGDASNSTVVDAGGNYSFTVENGSYEIYPSSQQAVFTPLSITADISNADSTGNDFTGAQPTHVFVSFYQETGYANNTLGGISLNPAGTYIVSGSQYDGTETEGFSSAGTWSNNEGAFRIVDPHNTHTGWALRDDSFFATQSSESTLTEVVLGTAIPTTSLDNTVLSGIYRGGGLGLSSEGAVFSENGTVTCDGAGGFSGTLLSNISGSPESVSVSDTYTVESDGFMSWASDSSGFTNQNGSLILLSTQTGPVELRFLLKDDHADHSYSTSSLAGRYMRITYSGSGSTFAAQIHEVLFESTGTMTVYENDTILSTDTYALSAQGVFTQGTVTDSGYAGLGAKVIVLPLVQDGSPGLAVFVRDDTPPAHASAFMASQGETGIDLVWAASSSSDTVTYMLSHSTDGSVYSDPADIGNVRAYVFETAEESQTGHYFRLYARDRGGNLSSPAEISLLPGQDSSFSTSLTGGTTAEAYTMISLPLIAPQLQDDTVNKSGAFLALEHIFGEYDPTIWRLFNWSEGEAYLEGLDIPTMQKGNFRLGHGYWLIHRYATEVVYSGKRIDENYAVPVKLDPGWNQVGSPHTHPVLLDRCYVVSGTLMYGLVSELNTFTGQVVFAYVNGEYLTTDTMLPFEGYWIKNNSSEPVYLILPSYNHSEPLPEKAAPLYKKPQKGKDAPPPPPSGFSSGKTSSGSSGGCFIRALR